jgi:hypothetical protein
MARSCKKLPITNRNRFMTITLYLSRAMGDEFQDTVFPCGFNENMGYQIDAGEKSVTCRYIST